MKTGRPRRGRKRGRVGKELFDSWDPRSHCSRSLMGASEGRTWSRSYLEREVPPRIFILPSAIQHSRCEDGGSPTLPILCVDLMPGFQPVLVTQSFLFPLSQACLVGVQAASSTFQLSLRPSPERHHFYNIPYLVCYPLPQIRKEKTHLSQELLVLKQITA